MKTMWMMRIAAAFLAATLGVSGQAQTAPEPVNPHATPEARALLAYLYSISGKATITGQHTYPNEGARWSDRAYDLTGKYPGLFGQDFGFSAGEDKDSTLSRPAMIAEAERQYRNGAVIALTWHAVKPTEDEPVTFHDSVQGHLTDYEWKELLTPGSPLNLRWCAQVDVIAGYLRQLRDAHVPVLFRPYHEMGGGWFWWGGRPGKDGSAALYRQIYDRFVNIHHLDNLVWVWNGNNPSSKGEAFADYYPGTEYADVVSIDVYGEFKQKYYDDALALAEGKPIALAEVGGLPSPEVLDLQPRWTYFMTWSEFIQDGNSLELANAVYHGPRALNRDDPRLAGPMEAIRKATSERTGGKMEADPVSPGATDGAKALLARLIAAPGQGVLSGQINDSSSPGAATDSVVQATAKQPAIYGVELATGRQPKPNPMDSTIDWHIALVSDALNAQSKHTIVNLNWRPARPTDDAPASSHGQLTDFEWNELLTPGSALNKRWCVQVDDVASTLLNLQESRVAVMWNPLPESNGKDFWWAGRKGIYGSSALYRQLFDRLVNHHGLHNLVWVWAASAPDYRAGGTGLLSDFYPGLLYTDAIQLQLTSVDPGFPANRFVEQTAVGKPLGVELKGELPSPETFAELSGWAWFLATPPAGLATRTEALRKLYSDPHIVSVAPAQ
jgi:mannan endo-1,4-beta-mannosidase